MQNRKTSGSTWIRTFAKVASGRNMLTLAENELVHARMEATGKTCQRAGQITEPMAAESNVI